MWKLTLCANALILGLFWLVAQVAITPAHNLLVRYAETGAALPILTDVAISLRMPSLAVPALWAVLTLVVGIRMKARAENARCQWLGLHTSISVVLGLVVLFFFALAGILPLLKIGAVL